MTLWSIVPRVNTQSASNTLADYTVPLKSPAASRPVTRPTTPTAPRSNSSIPPEIIQEIKTSNLILNQVQRQQRETHIRLAQINNLINNPPQSNCSWSSFFIIVLQLVTIAFLIYYIFSNTDWVRVYWVVYWFRYIVQLKLHTYIYNSSWVIFWNFLIIWTQRYLPTQWGILWLIWTREECSLKLLKMLVKH